MSGEIFTIPFDEIGFSTSTNVGCRGEKNTMKCGTQFALLEPRLSRVATS